MDKSKFDTINFLYSENTIVGLIIMAVIAFFGITIFPDFGGKIISYLIPLFIIVICIEIFRIRTNIQIIESRTENRVEMNFFTSGEDFDNYLKFRLKNAKDLKIIHFSEGGVMSDHNPQQRIYIEIIDSFIRSGNKLQRVFADTIGGKIFEDTKADLNKYTDFKYYPFFLENVLIREGRIHNVMIIDNSEVCLGGGYYNLFEYNTVSIRHKEIVKFHSDYFEGLKQQAFSYRNGKKIKWNELEKKIEEKKRKPNNG